MKDLFRLRIPLPDFSIELAYQHSLLSMGSCFAEHIGERLQRLKFQHQLNPFGIVYHPLVLANLLDKLMQNNSPQTSELFFHQELWRHNDFHSRYAHPEKEVAADLIQSQFERTAASLPKLNTLIITLGTAYGYRRKDTGEWVNNCHKQDASLFVKERAGQQEIVEALSQNFQNLKNLAPDLQVILTVSPVRHLRDGLQENQRSKAILLLATEELCELLPFVHYFPAYEILLDELRDYRFYTRDMLHPNELAIDYIWEAFQQALFSEETRQLSERIEGVVRSMEHRSQHPESAAAQAFQDRLQTQIRELEEAYDFLRF